MSAYPLPTAHCQCATCVWLRNNGMTETGPKEVTQPSWGYPRCAICGTYYIGGMHTCPSGGTIIGRNG